MNAVDDHGHWRARIVDAATVVLAICAVSLTGWYVYDRFIHPGDGREPVEAREIHAWEDVAAAGHWIGSRDAKVVIIEFGDYECPYCQEVQSPLRALAQLFPGDVSVVYRHLPLPIHPNAYHAARLAECAAAQGRFAAVHAMLYDAASLAQLQASRVTAAAQIPDSAGYLACAEATERVPRIEQDIDMAREIGITAVPALIVQGKLLSAPPDSASLVAMVTRLLEGSRSSRRDAQVRTGVVDLTIGALNGPAPYVFGRVSGLLQDRSGRIMVADAQANDIGVFDSTGVFLFSIGGEGSGPGELRAPCCPVFGPTGTLWVRDGGNARYVGFGVSEGGAQPVATVRMGQPDPWAQVPIGFAGDSGFIDTGYRVPPDERGLTRVYLTKSGRPRQHQVISEPSPTSLGTITRDSPSGVLYFPQPFGPKFLVALGPNGASAWAVSSQFSIQVRDESGDVSVVTLEQSEQGPPLSAQDVERAEAMIDRYLRVAGGERSDYPAIPSQKTLIQALTFDEDGRLWVILNTPDPQPSRAVLFDVDGHLVGRRSWPRNVSLDFPAWIGTDQALGTSTDSLGVQRIARIRFGGG